MFPSTFDQWFAIHNAKTEKKIPDEYKALFEECWNAARIAPEEEIKELKVENCNLQDKVGDYEDLENDLLEANSKLRKIDELRERLEEVTDEVEAARNSLDEAIEDADYQLIVDSVSKDLNNACHELFRVNNSFEAIDI